MVPESMLHVTVKANDTLEPGCRMFTEEYVREWLSEEWTEEIKCLAEVAVLQPHSVNATFTHSMLSCY